MLKVVPPGDEDGREPGRHAQALISSPAQFAQDHLVDQPWEPIQLEGNGWIMFQEIAGRSLRSVRSLDKVLRADADAVFPLASTSETIVNCVLGQWNPQGPVIAPAPASVPEYLQAILGRRLEPGGQVDKWAASRPDVVQSPVSAMPAWLGLPGSDLLVPNPIVLARDPALSGHLSIAPVVGNARGDLHPGNVIRVADEKSAGPGLWLIDLSQYSGDAPLARDPVHFLLSVLQRHLSDLSASQVRALARLVVSPDRASPGQVNTGLADLVIAIERTATAWTRHCGLADDWADQYLLALAGCGLLYAVRRPTDDEHREWFFWLAALAGREFLLGQGLGQRTDSRQAGSHLAQAGSQPRPTDSIGRQLWRVPPPVPYTVARTAELERLRGLLRTSRSVAIHGAPGTGKTQLAATYADRYANDYQRVVWISCEPAELIAAQVTEFVQAAGLPAVPDPAASPGFGLSGLRLPQPWLLILDDVSDAAIAAPFVAVVAVDGADVLITSRNPHLTQVAGLMELAGFDRSESLALFAQLSDKVGTDQAAAIAGALGDLPLAVAQAAEFLSHGPLTAQDYLRLLDSRTTALLASGRVLGYPDSLGGALSLALESLRAQAPLAAELLGVCAQFDAAPIPFSAVLVAGGEWLPPGLAVVTPRPLRLAAIATEAVSRGLLIADSGQLRLHPLIRKFVRDETGPRISAALAWSARRVLTAANPGDPFESGNWALYRQLLPHVLALDLWAYPDEPGRHLVLDTIDYLINIGAAATAAGLASDALTAWRPGSAPDAEPVLQASSRLARALFGLHRYAEARDLDEAVYRQRLVAQGRSAPATLLAEHNLAVDLTSLGAVGGSEEGAALTRATGLHAEVVTERGLVFGPEDPQTLLSAHNQAFHFRVLGEHANAMALEETVYQGFLARLGTSHPHTLRSARALAQDWRDAGQPERARVLEETAYGVLTQTFGPDHPDVLRSAQALVRDLHAIGEHARALALHASLVARLRQSADRPDQPVPKIATASPR